MVSGGWLRVTYEFCVLQFCFECVFIYPFTRLALACHHGDPGLLCAVSVYLDGGPTLFAAIHVFTKDFHGIFHGIRLGLAALTLHLGESGSLGFGVLDVFGGLLFLLLADKFVEFIIELLHVTHSLVFGLGSIFALFRSHLSLSMF